MAPLVVDGFESVEVEKEQRELLMAALGQRDGASQIVRQEPPVGESGQRVVVSQAEDLPVEASDFCGG